MGCREREASAGVDEDVAARLEDVDWSVVISPGTARRHGPELVLDLWRPEAAEAAQRTLRQVCALREYLYPAAAELLPVLVEAAADPAAVALAVPGLRSLADTDERPITHLHWRVPVRRHWRSVEADDALRTAVQAVLDAARPSGDSG